MSWGRSCGSQAVWEYVSTWKCVSPNGCPRAQHRVGCSRGNNTASTRELRWEEASGQDFPTLVRREGRAWLGPCGGQCSIRVCCLGWVYRGCRPQWMSAGLGLSNCGGEEVQLGSGVSEKEGPVCYWHQQQVCGTYQLLAMSCWAPCSPDWCHFKPNRFMSPCFLPERTLPQCCGVGARVPLTQCHPPQDPGE